MQSLLVDSLRIPTDPATCAVAVVPFDRALIQAGQMFTLAGSLTIADTKTGAIFFTPPAAVAASVTLDMTNATADLTFTAVAAGVDGNSINVTVVDPAANDAALAVSVFVKTITVSLATDETGTITSTAAEVVAAVAANDDAAALVTVTDEGAGSGVVEAVANTFLAGGANAATCTLKGISLRSNAVVSASLLEGYIKAAEDTVSALTPANRHRISSVTAQVDATGGTDVTPTQETSYTTLATNAISAGAPAYLLGATIPGADEWELATGVNYCLAIANASGGAAVVNYELTWSE